MKVICLLCWGMMLTCVSGYSQEITVKGKAIDALSGKGIKSKAVSLDLQTIAPIPSQFLDLQSTQ
jgi:hypothetical protein